MMHLFLVRHGQSQWNADRRLQGQADISLSDVGREQSLAIAGTLRALGPERVIASDLMRVRETADLLGYPDHEVTELLREIDVGAWTGRFIDDLLAEDPVAYQGWRAGRFTPPDGESWADFKERTGRVVADLWRDTPGRVLVVAHGGVIRAILEDLLGLKPEQIVPAGPGSLTTLRLGKPNGRDDVRLEVFNYTPLAPAFDPVD